MYGSMHTRVHVCGGQRTTSYGLKAYDITLIALNIFY